MQHQTGSCIDAQTVIALVSSNNLQQENVTNPMVKTLQEHDFQTLKIKLKNIFGGFSTVWRKHGAVGTQK